MDAYSFLHAMGYGPSTAFYVPTTQPSQLPHVEEPRPVPQVPPQTNPPPQMNDHNPAENPAPVKGDSAPQADVKGSKKEESSETCDWSVKATFALITLWSERREELMNAKNTDPIWAAIAEGLQGMGFAGYRGKQCKTKLGNLRSKYKETKDRKKQTGNGATVRWPFFEAMDEVLGTTAQVDPVCYVDAMGDRNENEDKQARAPKQDSKHAPKPEPKQDDGEDAPKAKGPPKVRGTKRKSDPLKGIVNFLQESEGKWQELEQKRIESEERQARERTKLMDLLIRNIKRRSSYHDSPRSPYRSPYHTPSPRPNSGSRSSHRSSHRPSGTEDLIDLLG